MTENDAMEIAEKYAEKCDWPWQQPIECKRKRRWFSSIVYVIKTNADKRGANSVITIDAENGKVIEARYLKR